MRIFICGASGAVGRPLIRLLARDGHEVTGTTRTPSKADDLAELGATPVVVNVYDLEALTAAMVAARPAVVIHQLTDLPDVRDPALMPTYLEANTRVRVEGTANVVTAAREAGATRLIAQSIAFIYIPGTPPYSETDPVQPTATGPIALEEAVMGAAGMEGVVLRYGRFFGPGTWADAANGTGSIHVDAAAEAAHLAVTRGSPGIYNVSADDGEFDISKARRELGFDPAFRLVTG